ncbi:class I SAM-dependent methyltransferase [Streptomyces sp. NPDC056491]|uniref:class I SAM-dependent methyltransferase n=1 Tax=Streptomyces sp. NPDC056491 TaxID=3345837 RepID=UPI0036B7BFED
MPAAIERARLLAARTGLSATFVEADTQRLPASLAGRFDVVVATYGVLCWIADPGAWMRSAATALRPGGSLVLVDLHPAFQTVATLDPLVVDWPYGGGPHRETVTGTYAEPGLALPAQECVQYPYSIGEVVTAAATAGLTVKHLGEHEAAEFDPRGSWPRVRTAGTGCRSGTPTCPSCTHCARCRRTAPSAVTGKVRRVGTPFRPQHWAGVRTGLRGGG